MDTGGFGGKQIREKVEIKTNDPNQPWLQVVMVGKVEKFAEIQPERVRLIGRAGQPLVSEVVIVPRDEYPFSIKEISVKDGTFVKYDLIERQGEGKGKAGWVIRVENKRKQKGRYLDTLFLTTNSEIRPTIPIYISGIIQ